LIVARKRGVNSTWTSERHTDSMRGNEGRVVAAFWPWLELEITRLTELHRPVVNLAARAVRVAGPGEIVAPPAIPSAAGRPSEPLGRRALKGVEDEVELCRVLGD